MTDDEVLGRLRDAERADDVLADPRWEAFARGELSAEDEHALRRRAADAGLGDDVFSALHARDEGREKDLIDLALREVAATHHLAAQATGGRQDRQSARPALARGGSSRRHGRTATIVGASLALAAGVFLAFMARGPHPLPMYTMEIEGGLRSELGSPERLRLGHEPAAEVERFVPGGEITILARPADEVEGAMAARAFLLREGRPQRWDAPIVLSESGVVRIKGTFERLFGSVQPGRWELIVAISRPDALPSEQTVAVLGARGGDGIRIVRHSIEIAPRRVEIAPLPPPSGDQDQR